jgi:hypothetical protein
MSTSRAPLNDEEIQRILGMLPDYKPTHIARYWKVSRKVIARLKKKYNIETKDKKKNLYPLTPGRRNIEEGEGPTFYEDELTLENERKRLRQESCPHEDIEKI